MAYYGLFLLILFVIFSGHLNWRLKKLNSQLNALEKQYEEKSNEYFNNMTETIQRLDTFVGKNPEDFEKMELELAEQLNQKNEEHTINHQKLEELKSSSYRLHLLFKVIGKIVLIYLVIAIIMYVVFYLSLESK